MAIEKRPPTKRELNAIETRKTLFNTALRLFSKYGYDAVTIEDITKRAGLSKGTFYNHFSSKEGVLIEQFILIDEHYAEVFKHVPEDVTASGRIMIFVDAMCDYVSRVAGIGSLQVIYGNQVSSPHAIRILNNKDRACYKILRDIAVKGKNSGEFPVNMDIDNFAEMIMRAARAVIFDWCLYNGSFNLIEEGRRYFSNILHSLRLAATTEEDTPQLFP